MNEELQLPQEIKPKDEKLPLWCIVCFILAAVSAILYLIFRLSPVFSDWFNGHISTIGRRLLSYLTVWIPFSAAELLILLLPVIFVALIVIGYRACDDDSARSLWIYAGKLSSLLCVIWIIFVWNFAAGYSGTTLDRKLELERTEVSATELHQTALILSEQLQELSDEILFPNQDSSSVMPYSYSEMNQKLMDAYDKYAETHDFPDHFYSRVKPVMLSGLMSYTHITGVYTFFTGEANINIHFPDYTIPFTAAHELAHQRGVAREDEANMIAFLVCMESDDAYIRYSALLNIYEYVASALYSADKTLYTSLYQTLSPAVIQEEQAYARFFEKYSDSTLAKISETTNDLYLQSQGATAGSRSYNLVVDLTVAYYRPRFQP